MRENVLCARGSAVVQWNSGHVWIIYPFAGEGVPSGRFLPAITRAQLMRAFQEWVGLCVCVCGYLKNWFKNSCTPRGVPHSEWICLEIGARSVGCVCRVPGQNGHLKSLFSTIYWTLTTPSRWAPHVPVGGVERIIHEFRSSTCLMVSLRGLIDFRQLVVKWPFHARRSFPSGPQSIMGALVLDVIVWLLEKSRFFIIIFFDMACNLKYGDWKHDKKIIWIDYCILFLWKSLSYWGMKIFKSFLGMSEGQN